MRLRGLFLGGVLVGIGLIAPARALFSQEAIPHTSSADSKTKTPDDNPNQAILDAAKARSDAAKAKPGQAKDLDDIEDARLDQAKTDYAIWSLKHAEAAYEWQHISTIIIFFVVVFLVLAGVVFSWMQFKIARHHPMQSIATSVISAKANESSSEDGNPSIETATAEKESVTEFSASPQGIKIASSAIGVVILVISMCFFYLYLAYVYPISVITADRASRPTQAADSAKGK